MEIAKLFYKLYQVDAAVHPIRFIGNAFPVTPNGGLLTCRHVVDLALPEGHAVAAYDAEMMRYAVLSAPPIFPRDARVDLAFLPNALGRLKQEFFPILPPQLLLIGFDVYTLGFFAIGARQEAVEQGYFGGKIINFFNSGSIETTSITLPFPILEGLSGSPILTYYNGPKLVGVAIGNRQTRILASEVIEVTEGTSTFRESINRIVEYGVAYHPAVVWQFLQQAGVNEIVVSAESPAIPGFD